MLILATVALDAACIALIFPILPSLIRSLTGTAEVAGLFGIFLGLYGLMQFLFSPLIGVMSDRHGRRPALLFSLSGSAICYLTMAFTPYLWLLFIGRAIAGMTGANIAVATAYIADITPEAERTRRFGFFQAAIGIGFIAGMAVSGVLGDISLRAPFLAAAALNGINLLVAVFVLPETHRPTRGPIPWQAMNPFGPLRSTSAFRALIPMLGIFLVINLVAQSYSAAWVLFAEDRYHWTKTGVGLSLAAFGALIAIAQMTAVGPLTGRLGDRGVLLLGIALEMTALLILGFAHGPWSAFAAVPLVALGRIGLPALQSMLTNSVDGERQGQLQGVAISLVSLATIFGPVAFGWIYSLSRPDWIGLVWIVCAGIYAFTVPIVLTLRR